jgi:NitT/TauT family transport system ATP-binding protein
MRFQNTVVFDSFNAEFDSNKINCILGPSGCGKTTLLNILSGTLLENGGEITKPHSVSYVFQEELLIPQKTARKNLELVLKSVYSDKTELKAVIDKFLKLSSLQQAADLYPHEMSGGMRQRLALIRAFAYPSDVLLMDEPFKALDITLKGNIIKAFLSLYKEDKRTVLFVTHDIDEALMTGDSIYVYSNKPMRLQRKIAIDSDKDSRKLYDANIIEIKNEVYRETEKWQDKSHNGL